MGQVAAWQVTTCQGLAYAPVSIFGGLPCSLFCKPANHSFNADYRFVNRFRNHYREGDGGILVVGIRVVHVLLSWLSCGVYLDWNIEADRQCYK
jgi:hypothetical protein